MARLRPLTVFSTLVLAGVTAGLAFTGVAGAAPSGADSSAPYSPNPTPSSSSAPVTDSPSSSGPSRSSSSAPVVAGGGNVQVGDTSPGVGGTVSGSGGGATPGGAVSIDLVVISTAVTNNFAPDYQADAQKRAGTYHLGTVTADASGNYSFSVPLPAGVSGPASLVVTDVTTGTVLSTVALDIGGGATQNGGGAPIGNGPAAGANNGDQGGTAYTGVAAAGIGALGLALLAGGGAMLYAGRRRRAGHV